MKHIIITPVFNEEKNLEYILKSIVGQTQLPIKWVLVDDNSTDNSALIIKDFIKDFPWITYLFHPSEPKKVQGSKVIEAFNFGLNYLNDIEYEIISKIDADLELPIDYFEKIIHAFNKNPKLGIAGGKIQEYKNDEWSIIAQAPYHVRGALKSYRKECFLEIDGLLPVLGWDGLDEMTSMYKGWQTEIINCNVKHYRPASTDYFPIKMQFKYGIANYKNGGNMLLALIRFLVKFKNKPYFLASLSFLSGYFYAFINQKPKNVDLNLAKFINNFHFRRIIKLKRY